MAVIRLDAEGRRKAIIDAALPLFARKGFSATTTKELAETAGVSEALIFKHFPSKAALYSEILQAGCVGDPVLERLKALEPSTETLIRVVHGLVNFFTVAVPSDPAGSQARQRLMVASFLEDGEFARLAYDWVQSTIVPIFIASMAAAHRSGDMVATAPVSFENRFWFAHHLASMLAVVHLSGGSASPHDEEPGALVRQAAWFILRGFGLKDDVIASYEGRVWEGCPLAAQSASIGELAKVSDA
jgi:AcrR family transcriptional regulator